MAIVTDSNSVDTTDGTPEGVDHYNGEWQLEVVTPPVPCKCTCCGHEHFKTPATFKVIGKRYIEEV